MYAGKYVTLMKGTKIEINWYVNLWSEGVNIIKHAGDILHLFDKYPMETTRV